MKKDMTLAELQAEVARMADRREDYIVPQNALSFQASGPTAVEVLRFQGKEFPLSDHSQHQLATTLRIPAGYYDRLRREHRDLLDLSVNRHLAETEKSRMIRTLDGQARAFLSERFLRVDGDQLLAILLPELEALGLNVESAHVNSSSLYVKVITPALEGEVSKGDVVRGGFAFSTSEVGMGQIRTDSMLDRLACRNGLIVGTSLSSYRRRHVGSVVMAQEGTGLAMNEVAPSFVELQRRVCESIRVALSEANFKGLLDQLRITRGLAIPSALDLEVVVLRIRRKLGLRDSEASAILSQLGREERSLFGLIQAVTRCAQDVTSYDRATEMEAMGGTLLGISHREWEDLVVPAAETKLAA